MFSEMCSKSHPISTLVYGEKSKMHRERTSYVPYWNKKKRTEQKFYMWLFFYIFNAVLNTPWLSLSTGMSRRGFRGQDHLFFWCDFFCFYVGLGRVQESCTVTSVCPPVRAGVSPRDSRFKKIQNILLRRNYFFQTWKYNSFSRNRTISPRCMWY